MLYQLWRCKGCRTDRVWGASLVHDPDGVAFLLCQGSCRGKGGRHMVTEHLFGCHTESASKGRV